MNNVRFLNVQCYHGTISELDKLIQWLKNCLPSNLYDCETSDS